MQIVITAIDDNPHYRNHLKAFLMSMRENSPGQNVRIVLMNCHEEYGEALKRIYPVDVVNMETHGQNAYQRNYIRHYMFQDAFQQNYSKVAWIDNDTLIRGDLRDGFWDGVEHGTIKVWMRDKKPDEYKFQTGIYILGNSKKSQSYIKGIIRALEGKDGWLLPQLLIYTLHREYGLKHIQLPQKYNDSKFRDSSVIWHCKQSHFKDQEFQEEFQYYLGKASRL